MPKPELPRIAVLGAGPIGIEAALYAKALGLPVTVYERGEVGEHVSRWGHVRLFTSFGWISTPLGLEAIRREHPQHHIPAASDLLTGNDFRDGYLLPLTLTAGLCDCIQMKTEVVSIGRGNFFKIDAPNDPKRTQAPFRILVRSDKQQERMDEADVVLDCTGTFGKHRWLGAGGIPALGELAAAKQLSYGLEDITGARKAHYAGKSTIVIGGGYSAATTVCNLATLAEDYPATWIIWLTRGPRSTPLPRNPSDPLRERDRLAARANHLAARGEGHVEYHALTAIETIECHGPDRGFRVNARCGNEEMTWEVERVIGNVGYRADLSVCHELHVADPDGKQGSRQLEPNYFLLGAKSFGRNSNFLLRYGYEQIRDAFALVTGKPKLDLYQGKMTSFPRLAA